MKTGMLAALCVVAFVSVRCQVAKEVPISAPVSIEGIYRYGNPCYSKDLYIKPDGSFHHIVWDCCTGGTHNEGTWRRVGDSIILEPKKVESKVIYPKAEVLSFARVQDTSEAKNIVRITVVDENDKPLSGATVSFSGEGRPTIFDGDELRERYKTNSLGQASFPLYLKAEVTSISIWRNSFLTRRDFPDLDEESTYSRPLMDYKPLHFTAYHGGPNSFLVRLQPDGRRTENHRSGRQAFYIGQGGVLRGKFDVEYWPKDLARAIREANRKNDSD